ncbi:integrase core domain-containing protein, partial [Patescibacteria group bacterium]|nr:integrase core domain-containing protein [Patescibacteria group bacterium]
MRAYKIVPGSYVSLASLSKDAQKRLWWFDWYFTHGENAEETCKHFNLSKSVFYRWKNRYSPANLRTLEDDKKTRRPHHLREMTTPGWILKKIYDIRLNDLEKSKYEIREELKREGIFISCKVIQKVINRHHELINTQHHLKVRKHKNYQIARIKAAKELKEKDLGSLVQVDTQYFYVLGKKFYLFSAIDCKSRYGFIYCYKTISSASGKDFLGKLRNYFPFPVKAVQTDNGSEYLLEFHKELTSLNILHFFIDPYCPKQNGRVERFHQTATYEYFNYQEDLLDDLEMINQHCLIFSNKYNTKRFHQSLGYLTPQEYVILQRQRKENNRSLSMGPAQ